MSCCIMVAEPLCTVITLAALRTLLILIRVVIQGFLLSVLSRAVEQPGLSSRRPPEELDV